MASVTFDSGIVTIQGDATADTFSLTRNNDQTSFTVAVNNDSSLTQTFSNANVSKVVVNAAGGDDVVAVNTLRVPTEIYGGPGNDTLRGGNADDFIHGGDGQDTIYGFTGNDELLGGAGDDLIFGAGGDDLIQGGSGNDELLGQGDNDTLEGQGGDDFISGGVGNDTLVGGSGADDLRGNSGDDSLTGSDSSADLYRGGTGFDTFTVHGEIGNGSADQVLDRFGMETFTGYSGPREPSIEIDGDTISVVGSDNRDVYSVTGFNSRTQFHVKRFGSVMGTYDAADFDEVVFHLGGGNDHFTTNESQVLIPLRVNGGEGADFIEGGNGPDQLFGGAGDDSIHARFGDDILVGGEGNDLLHGNHDNDQLFGGIGGDNLWGDSGDDIVVAGEDDVYDRLRGNSGFDQLFLELGEDLGTSGELIGTLSAAPAEPVFGSPVTIVDSNDGDPGGDPGDDDPGDGDPGDGDPGDGDPGTASIGDLVFEDLDGNGVFDSGEQGVADVMLRLLQNGVEINTDTTDGNGNYSFGGLAEGAYSVELLVESLDKRKPLADTSVDVTLAENEQNVDADFGVVDLFEAVVTAFALNLSETQFLEQASILSTEPAETTASFSILDIGDSKLAFERTDGNNPEYNLYGEFPSSLSAQQIEDSFGSGSDFASRAFFSTPISSLTFAPQEFLGAGFAAGSQVLIATSGAQALAVGSVSPTAAVSVFDSANVVPVVREAALQSTFTAPLNDPFVAGQQAQLLRKRIASEAKTQAARKAAWRARLIAITTAHARQTYWNAMNGPQYMASVVAAFDLIDPDIQVNSTHLDDDVEARFARLFLLRSLEVRGGIADVSDVILLHETIHVLNFSNGISADEQLDEQIAYGLSNVITNTQPRLGTPDTLLLLRGFESRWSNAGVFQATIQQDFDDTVYRVNVNGELTGSVGRNLFQILWLDPAVGGVNLEFLDDADWQDILDATTFSISLDELADAYSTRFSTPINAPNAALAPSIQ